jgi:hypothetical protein
VFSCLPRLALVALNVRTGWDDGYDLARVEAELKSLPSEMKELFEHLFKSIPDLDLRRAYQTFAMVLEFEPYSSKLISLACLYLDDFERFQFAMEDDAQKNDSTLEELNEYQILEWYTRRNIEARRLVHRYCKGLFEVREGSVDIPSCCSNKPGLLVHQHISLVQRSAVEFIQQHMETTLAANQPNHSGVIGTISQLHLAVLLQLHAGFQTSHYWLHLHSDIISMRALNCGLCAICVPRMFNFSNRTQVSRISETFKDFQHCIRRRSRQNALGNPAKRTALNMEVQFGQTYISSCVLLRDRLCAVESS